MRLTYKMIDDSDSKDRAYNLLVLKTKDFIPLGLDRELKSCGNRVTSVGLEELTFSNDLSPYSAFIFAPPGNSSPSGYVEFLRDLKTRYPDIPFFCIVSVNSSVESVMECVRTGTPLCANVAENYRHVALEIMREIFVRERKKVFSYEEEKTVLVVDDEPSVYRSFKAILGDNRYRMLYAEDRLEALQMLHNEKIGVVILDKRLPYRGRNDSGVKIARKMKELSPYTQVIMHTGYWEPEDAIELADIIFDYVQKPADLNFLENLVVRAYKKRLESINKALKKSGGHLWFLTGPRYAGKTEICRGMVAACPYVVESKRLVTRSPTVTLAGKIDIDLKEHHIVDKEFLERHGDRFIAAEREGYGYYIGIDTRDIEEKMTLGFDIILPFAIPELIPDLKKRYGGKMRTVRIISHIDEMEKRKRMRGDGTTSLETVRDEYYRFLERAELNGYDYTIWNINPAAIRGGVLGTTGLEELEAMDSIGMGVIQLSRIIEGRFRDSEIF